MKPATPAFLALLASRQFFVADLYVFTLVDGTVLRYCAGDKDITFGGNLYPCGGTVGPFFERSSSQGSRGLCKWKIGIEVDTLQFDVLPGAATVEGFSFLQACLLGFFDGAEMTLYRAFMPTYGDFSAAGSDSVELESGAGSEALEGGGVVLLETQDSVEGGLVNIFTGRVVEIDFGRTVATFNINSHLELLSQQMPRDLYQPGCLNTLYDAGCTLNRASFAVNGTIIVGSTVNQINTTLAQANGYFNMGTVTFTSGQNTGFTRSVKVWTTGGNFTLLVPLPFTPAIGDTFTIYPGCDKKQATCSGKFSNLANFRGQPYVPAPETGV